MIQDTGHMDFDVVVVGSGSSGMTAAVVSARLGLKVLLVEKTEYFGGISALSGGGCWIPGNPLMGNVGLQIRAKRRNAISARSSETICGPRS